jgi:uncharacterized DUF497 family protein
MKMTCEWDAPNDTRGNVAHVARHKVTQAEVEQVLNDFRTSHRTAEKTGRPIAYGRTKAGRKLAVVYVRIRENPLHVRPITAFDIKG